MGTEEINNAFSAFGRGGEIVSTKQFTAGLINSTYLVETDLSEKYILQKINTYVFKNPDGLMKNIVGVTKYLAKEIEKSGGNPERETLSFIESNQGRYYYTDSEGGVWRMYNYVDNAFTYNKAPGCEVFRSAGKTFGSFMKLLDGYPAHTLYETVESFHNTPVRYTDLITAAAEDAVGRRSRAEKEISFVTEREPDSHRLTDLMEKGILTLRVTHNDTKLNNLLFDEETNKGICVIDLDTIMPGLAAYDFGDSIRSGANTANQAEDSLSDVHIDLELFESYVDGYLSETAVILSDAEIESLVFGARLMTLECGIRFLTDYLNGDLYFKINYPEHNIERARNQFRLVEDMERNTDKMQSIVMKYKEKYRKA